jgi:Flp pilus assembly protein TadD
VRAADAGPAINPNNPYLYGWRAAAKTSLGRFEEAKSDLQQATRLSPRDPIRSSWYVQLGDSTL